VVPADAATGLVDPGAVAAAVRPETVLVCVNHASNVTGTLQDLGAIGAVLARFGAGGDGQLLLLVDGAQSLGHTLVDMRAMRVDMLAFPGHKGLLGPTGTGGLCVRPGVEARLDTVREGGTGSASEVPSHPTMMPEKYEAGSHNVVGIAGLGEGVRWLLERGVEAVRAHELELMARLTAHLRPAPDGRCAGAPGLRLLGPIEPERRVGVFSFVHDELSAQELSAALEVSYGVLTRAGLHCAPLVHELLGTSPAAGGSGAVRLSLGPFLTGEDVDYACAALGALCREYAAVAVK
jgi:selenocysteine lyase/cysteine desulfurase